MFTRRQLLRTGTVTGAALLMPAFLGRPALADPVHGGTLDPGTLPKYATPLKVLPVMPRSGSVSGVDNYAIAARQFRQQILPAGYPRTTVFGYGSADDPDSFHFPAYSIEATVGRPVRVRWDNGLVTSTGAFRPHILPVDPTLHWSNPPGGTAGRDSRPTFKKTPGPYRGPVPLVTHLHGSHTFEEYDGYPEAWYLPAAKNIPSGYAKVGSFFDKFKTQARNRDGVLWQPGSATFTYANDQRATMLWYHSHDLGATRVNLQAGLTGLYLLRGGSTDLKPGVLPGPAPKSGDKSGTRYHEIPLIIQDRSFNTDGSLFFPASRALFGDVPADVQYIPASDVSPIWNPEFFGNTIVVNGTTWPVLTVEPRRYRFRLLNACNARTLLLKIAADPLAERPAEAVLPLWTIGTDGGFLPAAVRLDTARMGPAERLDVIVDFTGLAPGSTRYLINEGPDSPYAGGQPTVDFPPSDPGTTGQVLKFVVGKLSGKDTSVPPEQLHLPAPKPLPEATATRLLSLNEMDSTKYADAPVVTMLGLVNADGSSAPQPWAAEVTETVKPHATEVWELHNFTGDGHPIHLHQVQFEVVDRQPFGGTARPPESWESGTNDTVFALPGEITRLKVRFDIRGRFVWHCHIVDHEDNEMMRPIQVG